MTTDVGKIWCEPAQDPVLKDKDRSSENIGKGDTWRRINIISVREGEEQAMSY